MKLDRIERFDRAMAFVVLGVYAVIALPIAAHLLEPTASDASGALYELASARDRYTPYAAVDGKLNMYTYTGYTINRLRISDPG
jgi:hypothetical protein